MTDYFYIWQLQRDQRNQQAVALLFDNKKKISDDDGTFIIKKTFDPTTAFIASPSRKFSDYGRKMAVIINGDSADPHIENVNRALKNVLRPQGYETFVVSARRPSVSHDHYFPADREGMKKLIEQLKKKSDSNTELVIYTTGHGGKRGFCLGGDCNTQDLLKRLDAFPYVNKRVVVMDQCYGGGFGKLFLNDPKTLFISAGSPNETNCCSEIAPRMWAPADEVPDSNGDGVVSWRERFAYGAVGQKLSSKPQFMASSGYLPEEEFSFSKKVQTIQNKSELDSALTGLHPGQYAIITFSAEWCGPCKAYRPEFDRFAREGKGEQLWLRTENVDLAHLWGISSYPTVMIVNSKGSRHIVTERNLISKELAAFRIKLNVAKK